MRQTTSVVYLSIDEFLPSGGKTAAGFEEFSATLDRAGVPCIWLTQRTRLQIDEPRRKLGNTHPFIAEGGCGVYLPEDYFHLRPQSSRSDRTPPPTTVRLGRFTCLPIAELQPAAAEALEALGTETGVSVVPLRSLRPREQAQNTGLPLREAELARQRDFDELFYFAGASEAHIREFQNAAEEQGMQLRKSGALWSLALGASMPKCIGALAKLYDRALHAHARTIGIGVWNDGKDAVTGCDRGIRITTNESDTVAGSARSRRVLEVPLNSADLWDQLAAEVLQHR